MHLIFGEDLRLPVGELEVHATSPALFSLPLPGVWLPPQI